jgi:hypothetical protein
MWQSPFWNCVMALISPAARVRTKSALLWLAG